MGRSKSVDSHLRSIAGIESDPRYAGGKRGGSDFARSLRALVESIPLEELSGEQLDHIGRIAAALQSATWRWMLQQQYAVRSWKSGRNYPGVIASPYGGYDLDPSHREWMDHLSRLVSKEDGQVTYVSELYGIRAEGIRQLATLSERWDVSVDAHWSTHFPGRTLAVWIRSRPMGA